MSYLNGVRFPYACECGDPNCRRRLRLTRPEYERRSAKGPVLAAGCAERGGVRLLEEWAA